MKYLFVLLAVFALTFSAQAQQPTPHQIVKLALGLGEGNIDRAYEVYGKKLGTVDVRLDTVWNISPVVDSLGVTHLDSIISHVNKTTTPRPAYAWEILSHWREEVITSWKKAKRDSLEAAALKTIQEPSF